MKDNLVIVTLCTSEKQQITDLAVPLDLSAAEFLKILNQVYRLGINLSEEAGCYLRAEEPLALLRGDVTLEHAGIHTGSFICLPEEAVYDGRQI